MTRRPGLSLTEVLVALFIMGLGTIAILTLFPLGALNMAQAFRDDRTTQCAAQAGSYIRWYWKHQKDASQLDGEPFFTALDDPAPPWFTPPSTPGSYVVSLTPADNGPSYPVVIDPMGVVARPVGSASQLMIGDDGRGDAAAAATPNQTNLARKGMRLLGNTPALALRTCSLLDGYGYEPNGTPTVTGTTIDRDMRYNWLWVIQRPVNSERYQVDATVVVFDRRAHLFAPAGSETVFAPSYAEPGVARVTFPAGRSPAIQKGSWLLDATTTIAFKGTVFVPPNGPTPLPVTDPGWPPQPHVRNANFYRVLSATTNVLSGELDVELEVPLRPDRGGILPPAQANLRRFVVMNGVAEVFELSDPVVAK
jgi:hypothetical protein